MESRKLKKNTTRPRPTRQMTKKTQTTYLISSSHPTIYIKIQRRISNPFPVSPIVCPVRFDSWLKANTSFPTYLTCCHAFDWCREVTHANASLHVGAVNRQNTNTISLTEQSHEGGDCCGIKNAPHIWSDVCMSGTFHVYLYYSNLFRSPLPPLTSSLRLLLQLNCVYSDYHLISSVAILN